MKIRCWFGFHEWGLWDKPYHKPGGGTDANYNIVTWTHRHARTCPRCGDVEDRPTQWVSVLDRIAMERKYGPRGY